MSVPLYKRAENRLDAYKLTVDMISYTLHMLENEKIFPKKSRWTLCTRIIDTCLDSSTKIYLANKIQPKNVEEVNKRLSLQSEVLTDFEILWNLMTIAEDTYNIPSNKIETWCNYLLDAENKTKAWNNGDIKRFKESYKTL